MSPRHSAYDSDCDFRMTLKTNKFLCKVVLYTTVLPVTFAALS